VAVGPLVVTRMADWMKQQTLTRRQEEILRQLMLGFSNKIIARKLALAIGTVKSHVKAIMQKLDAKSRTEAAAIAQRRGILEEEYEYPPLEVRPAGIGVRLGATQPRDRSNWSQLSPRSVNSDSERHAVKYVALIRQAAPNS
jgi:DNA-binding CsgD family transcriptional regulator